MIRHHTNGFQGTDAGVTFIKAPGKVIKCYVIAIQLNCWLQ